MAVGQMFSQRFGYGVHALAYLANKPLGAVVPFPELAEWALTIWQGASETYLSNVVQRMARGGLLRSHRGVSGGYSLARPATEITLRDVVQLLEGIDTDRCSLSLESACPVSARCSIQGRLRKLERDYLEALARISIADLARDVVVTPADRATT
jgi:Rrf2 family protein